MFRDNYTDFSFDDIHSSNFKVWITNKNDLQRSMSPNFSDKFNSPTYGQTRYYEGTTIDKQDFKLSCAAIDITLNEWRAICEWLSPLKSGKLRFDWNDKYYYMVKISKAPSGTMFIRSKIDNIMGQLYVVEFTLEFTNVYDWAAIGSQAWYENTGDNSSSLTVSCYNNSYYMPAIVIPQKEETVGTYYKVDTTEKDEWNGNLRFKLKSGDYYLEITQNSKDGGGYYYNLLQFTMLKGETGITTLGSRNIELPYYLPTNIWELSEGSEDNASIVWTQNNSLPVIFANTGAYEMYPKFTFSKDAILYDSENEPLYQFTYLSSNTYALYTDVDFKTGAITFNDNPINDTYYNMLDDQNYNKGPVGIGSGRPELWKVIVGTYKYDANTEKAEILLLLNSKPIYSRNKPFLLHLFTEELVKETNIFNESLYDAGIYSYDPTKLGSRKLFYCPEYTVEYGVDDYSCWAIRIDLSQPGLKGYSSLMLDASSFKVYDKLYLSICDCEQVSYKTQEGGKVLVGCYPRDVI